MDTTQAAGWRAIGWRAFLACFCAVAICSAATAEECMLGKLASFTYDPSYGAPVVVLTLNGTEHHFTVNTASSFSAIDPTVATALGLRSLQIPNLEIYGGGQKIDRYVTVLRLLVGQIPLTKWQFVVLPEHSLPAGIDGTIGYDMLRYFDLDFDFPAKTMNLMSPKHCKGRVVYWATDYVAIPFRLSVGNHMVFPMQLDGMAVSVSINSGSGLTTLSESVARTGFHLSDDSPGVERPSSGPAHLPGSRYRFESLSAEGLNIKNPLIYILPDDNQRAFRRNHADKVGLDPILGPGSLDQPNAYLGMDILSKLHVYVAYEEKVVYLSSATAR